MSLVLAGAALAASGQVGEAAPPYEARLMNSAERVTLSEQRGKAVLLNKWATWCRPCIKEMPELEKLYRAHRSEGFVVIGVSIDRGDADGPTAAVAKERGVTYAIWRDSEDEFTQTFRSTGVPESILVDREGTVVYRWRGALEATPGAERLIESALASTGDYGAVARAATAESTNSIGFALAVLAGLLSF
ncbi:MAG: TlpA disulfide reductase family protein, partial [Gaiellaceae bacterium]